MLRLRAIARSGWHRIVAGLPGINVTERVQAIRDLQMQCAEHVVERLQQKLASPESDEPAEDVSTLLLEYQRSITPCAMPTRPSPPSRTRQARPKTSNATACASSSTDPSALRRRRPVPILVQAPARECRPDAGRPGGQRIKKGRPSGGFLRTKPTSWPERKRPAGPASWPARCAWRPRGQDARSSQPPPRR